MPGPILRACRNCSFIDEADVCPRCGGETTKDWAGYLAVVDYEKSEIAKRMGISSNGRYALKVR